MSEKLLLIEIPGYRPLPSKDLIKKLLNDDEIHCINSNNAAISAINTIGSELEVLISNAPLKEVFQLAKSKYEIKTVLVTNQSVDDYNKELHGETPKLLDYVISNHLPNPFTTVEYMTCLKKVLMPEDNIFGIEAYLKPGTAIQHELATSSLDRESLNNKVSTFAKENGLRGYVKKQAYTITEELLMNAIYDAPFEAGRHQEIENNRTAVIKLEEDEFSTLSYGYDGDVFAISVRDQFGLFRRDKFISYISKVLIRHQGSEIMDKKKRGAGIGLYMILYNSNSLICNVDPEKSTEVIALIHTKIQLRDFGQMPRSVQYFTQKHP